MDASKDHRDLVPDYCKYVTTDNESIGHNRNVGINLATREFITFCDGDDFCLDGKTSLYRFFEDGVSVVFGDGYWGNTTFSTFSRKLHNIELISGEIISKGLLLRGNIIPNGAWR